MLVFLETPTLTHTETTILTVEVPDPHRLHFGHDPDYKSTIHSEVVEATTEFK